MSGSAMVLAAIAPIVVVLALMLGARWSAARAGTVGFAAAVALAAVAFGYGREVHAHAGPVGATGGALAEAGFTAATILWIIGPALAIYHLQVASGATAVLRDALTRLSADPRLAALLIAWFFALFVEGAAGFGASVALAAPFLVAAGYGRMQAVVMAMIGHAVGVSFGAIGAPVVPQAASTGFDPVQLARATAAYHGLLGWLLAACVTVLAARASGVRVDARAWAWTALAAGLFLVPFTALAWFVGPELPTLGGAVFGGGAFAGALWLAARRRQPVAARPAVTAPAAPAAPATPRAEASMPLWRAAAPYLALVALVFGTRLVPPVGSLLASVTWGWGLAGVFRGAVAPLYHPGTILAVSLLAGVVAQRTGLAGVAVAVRRTAAQLAPVTVALVAMLALSRVMVHAGMITVLAHAAAGTAGGAWPLLAPFVGVLGTFVTGSATASNILFSDFQQATAVSLGLAALPLLGAQGFGAAIGNVICPHNIIAANATVDLAGREGEVLRRTLPVCLAYAALGGAVALLLS